MIQEIDKYKKYQNDCVRLNRLGYDRKHFFYAIGGGEDEDGEDILIKGDVVLSWDYSTDRWYKGSWSLCNYVDGIDCSGGCIDINSL